MQAQIAKPYKLVCGCGWCARPEDMRAESKMIGDRRVNILRCWRCVRKDERDGKSRESAARN